MKSSLAKSKRAKVAPLKKSAMARHPIADASSAKDSLRVAAVSLFAIKGLDGVTVREIAELAKVNLSLISYYFGGKEGLYRSCIEEYGKNRLTQVQDLMVPARNREDFFERLKAILYFLMDASAKNHETSRMISREIEMGLPNARDVFEATLLKGLEHFLDFIQDAQKKGYVKKNVDARAVVLMLHSTVTHCLRAETVLDRYFKISIFSEKSRKQLSEAVVRAVVYGILESEK